MKSYVLDTNFFFNLQVESGFGDNPREIIERVTDYARKLQKAQAARFYMPPRVVDEMYTFIDENQEYLQDLLAVVTIKAPDYSQINFSATVFYDLVKDIRSRSYRGLQVAEEELLTAAEAMSQKQELSKIEFQKTAGEHISKLRERYRNATRTKFLDSPADLDVIVLAKELQASVVSADEGVILWARKFGVMETFPQGLRKELDSLLLA